MLTTKELEKAGFIPGEWERVRPGFNFRSWTREGIFISIVVDEEWYDIAGKLPNDDNTSLTIPFLLTDVGNEMELNVNTPWTIRRLNQLYKLLNE